MLFTIASVLFAPSMSYSLSLQEEPTVIIKFCSNYDADNDLDAYTVDTQWAISVCGEGYEGYSSATGFLVLIYAPSWNVDPYKIESIGNSIQHPITVYTTEDHLSLVGSNEDPINGFGRCVGFTEIGPDSGLYAGVIGFTGVKMDYDGDGIDDGSAQTYCGTANAYGELGATAVLAPGYNGNVTLAWRVSENHVITKNAQYSYGKGQLSFDKEGYDYDDEINVVLFDADLRRAKAFEKFWTVHAWSDSDLGGIDLKMFFERNEKIPNSFDGTHGAKFFVTQHESRDNFRLHANPGDIIYLRYDDYTLSYPTDSGEFEKIIAKSHVEITAQPKIENPFSLRLTSFEILNADMLGNTANLPDQKKFKSIITNQIPNNEKSWLGIVIKNNGVIHSTSFDSCPVGANSDQECFFYWNSAISGNYTVSVHLLQLVDGMQTIVDSKTISFSQ